MVSAAKRLRNLDDALSHLIADHHIDEDEFGIGDPDDENARFRPFVSVEG